jgi:polar amino acid transport system substrate-binding protein
MYKKLVLGICFFSQISFAEGIDEIKWLSQKENDPYSFVSDKGKNSGIAIDLLDAILKKLNAKTTIDQVEFDVSSRCSEETKKNKNTAYLPYTKKKEREKDYKWVSPLITYQPILLAKKSSNIKINSPEDLKKYSIGVKINSITHKYLQSLGQDENKIFTTPINRLNVEKLIHDRVDMVSCPDLAGFSLIRALGANENDYEVVYKFESSSYGIAFNKETSDETINKIQKALDELKTSTNGKPSEYDIILSKYK